MGTAWNPELLKRGAYAAEMSEKSLLIRWYGLCLKKCGTSLGSEAPIRPITRPGSFEGLPFREKLQCVKKKAL